MKKEIKIILGIIIILLLVGCSKTNNNLNHVNLNETKEIEIGKLHLTIPKIYEKEDTSTDTFHFYRIKEDDEKLYDYSFCSFELLSSKYYSENYEDEIKKELTEEYFKYYKIKKKTINGIEWYYAEANSNEKNGSYYTQIVYFTVYENVGYHFEATSFVPEDMPCDKLFNPIIESLTLK